MQTIRLNIKRRIETDAEDLKGLTPFIYFNEFENLIKMRIHNYNLMLIKPFETEERLKLFDLLKEYIFKDITKDKFLKKLGGFNWE